MSYNKPLKVVVIGNGPSALRCRRASMIQKADVVVRMNNFKTQGFERYIGSRTDILFTCRLNEYLETLHQFPQVIISLLMNPLEGVEIPEKLLRSSNIVEVIDWPEILELTPILQLREDCYPSTGLICVIKMLRRFGHLYLLGFDNFVNGNRHYFQEGTRAIPTRHDGPGECRILHQLADLGLVTLL
jgi:hypothetical protein